jgi:hypothetical protein
MTSRGDRPLFRVDTFPTGEVYQLAGCEGGLLAANNYVRCKGSYEERIYFFSLNQPQLPLVMFYRFRKSNVNEYRKF